MSCSRSLFHIVINTYRRRMTIPESHCDDLYRYISGIILNKHSSVYSINGVGNHIHILLDLATSVALGDLIKEIKVSSNTWMKSSGNFPDFYRWGKEYYACSISPKNAPAVDEYIRNQKIHHRQSHFDDELRKLVINSGNQWNDNMLQ